MSRYTEETVEELLQAIEEVANLLRGMTFDPAIPDHAKESMRTRAADLDAIVKRKLNEREP